jgi:hypothetical protein
VTTLRRALLVGAAALTLSSLVLPLWGFRMSAPQYPDEALHLEVRRTGITGDLQEIDTLQHYIGVSFPRELPELDLLPPAIGLLSVLLVVAAVPGEGVAGRLLRFGAAGAFCGFLLASLVVVQVRLYEVGHERDPRAPIKAVRNFTPPAIGPVKVGNFTVWSFPHAGGLALAAAFGLSVAGARGSRRDRTRVPRVRALRVTA